MTDKNIDYARLAWIDSKLSRSPISFELWTSGTFTPDAIDLLNNEKLKRTKSPIDWKDRDAVLALGVAGKEKSMADAFKQHYMHHPFPKMATSVGNAFPESSPIVSIADILNVTGSGTLEALCHFPVLWTHSKCNAIFRPVYLQPTFAIFRKCSNSHIPR